MPRLHYPDLLEDRRELYLDLLVSKDQADIRLLTEDGRETLAHQAILSAASPSLANILLELSELDTAITLVDLSHEELEQVLVVIYTGELRSSHPASVDRITEIARHLGLGEVTSYANNQMNELKLENKDDEEEDEMLNLEELLDDEDFIRNVLVEAESEREVNHLEVKEEPLDLEEELVFIDLADDPAINDQPVGLKTEELCSKQNYRCDVCEKYFDKNSILKEHVKSKHEGVKYPCNKCDYQASHPSTLQKHNQSKHLGTTTTTTTKWRNGVPPSYWVWGRYICEICKKDCGYANNLNLHRKRSHGLHYRQESLGYNGEIPRGSRINQTPSEPIALKRKREAETPVVKKFMSKAMPCFECTACKKPDCMKCKWCHDKRKYGGPGKLNKRCITRRCTNPKVVEMQDHLKTRSQRLMAQFKTPGLVKQMPCRSCATCIMEDCGNCRPCLDKRKFGGPGKMNKRCKMKVCLTPKDLGDPSTVPSSYVRRQPEYVSSKFSTRDDHQASFNADISFEDEESLSRAQSPDYVLPNTKESLENFIEMGLEGSVQPNMVNNISLTEFELEKSPTKAVKTVAVSSERLSPSKCRVAVEFWAAPDSEESVGVIGDKTAVKDLCWVCGSAGQAKLLYCTGCCHPFHYFCLAEDAVPRTEEEVEVWECGQCVRCRVCAGLLEGEADTRCCSKCGQSYHTACLAISMRDRPTGPAGWLCGSCLQCESCGAPSVSCSQSEDGQLCRACCQARLRGDYCTLCKGFYQQEDYEEPMMECGDCGGWIHAKCEGIDGEEYQVLSLLPDNVEFVCKVCANKRERLGVPDWREAVASEIRKGQATIVSSLLQHDNSRYFQHDFLHSAAKQRNQEEIGNPTENLTRTAFADTKTVNKNLTDEDDEAEEENQSDGSSLLSLASSLPSSLCTDPAPSLFSYSSYETAEPYKITAMSSTAEGQTDVLVKSCSVNVRKMLSYSWRPHCSQANLVGPDRDECKDKSEPTDSDIDILEFSEFHFPDETILDDIIEDENVDFAVELNELEKLVGGCGFSSILDLHLNICQIIESTPLESADCDRIKQEVKSHYLAVLETVFPWFLPEDPGRYWREWEPDSKPRSSSRHYTVKPPSSEHSYASRKRKSGGDLVDSLPQLEAGTEAEDERRCGLCGVSGEEDEDTGRLLPYKYNEWLHLSCALWSSEVYETMDGSLENVVGAVTRSRNLLCTVCHNRGATIGCCHADCSANFHFHCGLEEKADFKEDKTVYCYKHAQKYASKENVQTFQTERFVWIDADPEDEKSRPGKHRSKFQDYRNVTFSTGGLRIDNLGTLVAASDTEKALVPVGFSATKSFWSAVNPRQMTKYRCTTRLVRPQLEEEDSKNLEQNIVIDHSQTEEHECRKILSDFRKFLVSKELEENVEDLLESDSIISPRKVSQLWSWLDCRQLRDPPAPPARPAPPTQPPARLTAGLVSPAQRTPPSSPSKTARGPTSGSSSPLKLNKAVVGFRSPAKVVSQEQELFYSDEDSGDSLRWRRLEESQVQRVWFNANKMFKVREMTTQTSQYYDEVQIASNNVYSNSNPPPRTPPPPPPLPDSCDFLDGLNLMEQANLLTNTGEPFDICDITEDLLGPESCDDSNSSEDILSFVTDSLETGQLGEEQVLSKIIRMDRERERSDTSLTTSPSIPQLDGAGDDVMDQYDGATDEDQIVVVDEEQEQEVQLAAENIKQESSRMTPMMDLEGDIPGSVISQAVLCSSCGNTLQNKKAYEAHCENCPAVARAADKADTESSPRKDFSILGLLKQEDMKTEAPEAAGEEDIMIISENISQPGTSLKGLKSGGVSSSSSQPGSSVQYHHLPGPGLPYTYPGPVLQYPGYSAYPPTYLPAPILPVGGYIAVPPLQPIYYNNPHSVQQYLQPTFPHLTPSQPQSSSVMPPPPAVTAVAPVAPLQTSQPPPRKVARVQPTPHIVRPIPTKLAPPAHRSPGAKSDPMSALSNLSKNPVAHTDSPTDLSISHRKLEHIKQLRQVQPRTGKTLANIPQDWRSVSPKQEVIEVESGSCSPASVWGDHEYCSSPEPDQLGQEARRAVGGVNITTKSSKTNSIKLVLQAGAGEAANKYRIKEVTVKDGTKSKATINPKTANRALKMKAKSSRPPGKRFKSEATVVPLGPNGEPYHARDTFVNQLEVGGPEVPVKVERKQPGESRARDSKEPYIMYSLWSEDGGISLEGRNITQLWQAVYESVSNARAAHKMSDLPSLNLGPSGEDMLGLTHTALRYLLEQVPGARAATNYQWRHQEPPPQPEPVRENPSGCARTEVVRRERKPHDMFAWLASRLRKKPHPNVGLKLPPEIAAEAHLMEGSSRRATSLDLPMAMRYRQLAKNAKEAVAVYASGIHGRGLFCKREISAGEMVIEYCGEQIRAILTDYREKYYDDKGIGCYMFKVDDDVVLDATVKGNAARFINHSCEPNCYSKIADIMGSKHIIIFALRKIFPGEELTYDYKFPKEEQKLKCHCGARKCKKFMN